MADVPSTLNSWSSTSSSNLPANSAAVGPNTLADNQRTIQAVVRAALAGDGTIASATITDLSTVNDGDITVTGTTTITGFGTLTAGIKKVLTFSGALTLTHNATSLILPGAANITTAAGDVAIMRSLGSGNWKCIAFTSITGNVATATNATNATTLTGTTTAAIQTTALGSGTANATTFLRGDRTFAAPQTSTTQAYGDNSTNIATTAYADRMRDVPANVQTTSYSLVDTDRGKSIDTTAGVTIPLNSTTALAVGHTTTITNTSAVAITITQAAGVTLRQAGTANTGNRTLAAYGVATVRKVATDTWFISGAGLT